MKFLFLTIGLCMVNELMPDTLVNARPDFKPEQINGNWFSIAVLSNRQEDVMPGGPRRFQIYSFQVKKDGNIDIVTYTNWKNVCHQANITLTETKVPGQYKVKSRENSYFLLDETDCKNFLIMYCQIGKNNGLWELLGREKHVSRIYKMKFEVTILSHGFQTKDISYFSEKERCPKKK